MFVFKRHRVRAKDKKKTMNMSVKDWVVLDILSKKLKVPKVQVVHDALIVYSGFVYGADDQQAKILETELKIMKNEWAKDLIALEYYKQQFGEIEIPDDLLPIA